jgi:alpha-L-fucosidase
MIYFDDSVLPFHGVTDQIGLNLVAHFYNSSVNRHGRNEAVVNAKMLDDAQRRALVYDIERGKAEAVLPQPWQTDTCLGSWHYDREIFVNHRYKSAASVVRMLADIVSKNGNLMLSVPLQRDGTPDSDEIEIVKGIGTWLNVNGEAIYATRPWKIYGEGPSTASAGKGSFGGQQDVQKAPFTAEDIRFTASKDGRSVYAIVLEIPADGRLTIKSLGSGSPHWAGAIRSVRLLGGGDVEFARDEAGLHVTLPGKMAGTIALALRIGS